MFLGFWFLLSWLIQVWTESFFCDRELTASWHDNACRGGQVLPRNLSPRSVLFILNSFFSKKPFFNEAIILEINLCLMFLS